jgi:ribokinase
MAKVILRNGTILVDHATSENTIVVVPGACARLTVSEVETARDEITSAALAKVDYLTPNETEALGLISGDQSIDPEDWDVLAGRLLQTGVKNVILTLGERGAFFKTKNIRERVPAFRVGPVVETTGAGDAFAGGFAVALAEGKSIVEATRYGCAVAGISVTRPGTAPSVPYRDEVDQYLEKVAVA